MGIISDDDAARFWARVEMTEHCWYWLCQKRWAPRPTLVRANNYSTFAAGNRSYAVHKLAYLLAGGTIGKGMVVRHLCGDSGCVNPSHLLAGTYRENMLDQWWHRRNPGTMAPRYYAEAPHVDR